MARSKALADLRKKEDDDLRADLDAKRQEIMDLRFSKATGALENSSRLGLVKRDVARILTVLNERQPSAGRSTPTESAATAAAGATE